MKSAKAILIIVIGLSIWLAGCEVSDRKADAVSGAVTPYGIVTRITMAPLDGDTTNHYMTLRWAGNDADGEIVAYLLFIDDVLVARTLRTDTTLAFAATADGVPTRHRFHVAAVDNDGNIDAQPPTRTFYVVNYAPRAQFNASETIPPNQEVGKGFRVTVSATDTNLSLLYYSCSLDDTLSWLPWSSKNVYLFADPALIHEDTAFFGKVNGVSNVALTPGSHTLYVRAKDAGEALSNLLSLSFTVVEDHRPILNPSVTGTYNEGDLYPDGSAYYVTSSGAQVKLAFSASAASYNGEILSYRWRIGNGAWVPWAHKGSADTSGLSAGDHQFEIMARDLANSLSLTDTFQVRLVRQSLSRNVLIVNETRNGNGGPGSPTEAQTDAFYDSVMSGAAPFVGEIAHLNYAWHTIDEASYISPYDVQNAGLILWHADDRAEIYLNDNFRLLKDYLNQGGRLIVSGWSVLGGYVPGVTADTTLAFASGSFGREQLRLFSATYVTARNTTGFRVLPFGAGTLPETCHIDSTKLSNRWHGKIDFCWVFRPRGECAVTGRLLTADSSHYTDQVSCYLYDISFRTAVFGVPLFFCRTDEVTQIMTVMVPHMLQGLN
jgi:hypothetical protein